MKSQLATLQQELENYQQKMEEKDLKIKAAFEQVRVTCDFQQCDILTSVDSDQHVQHPFNLRNSK